MIFCRHSKFDAQGLNDEYNKIGMEVFHAFSGLTQTLSMFTSEQLAKLHPTPTNKNFLTADDIFGVIEVKLAERDEIRRNQSSW